jgi:hypothetical protein
VRTGRGWQRWAVPTAKTSDPLALLDALNADGVEYLVVGGSAAVLHGAPVTTQDLDIVDRLTAENINRLQRCLSRLHAVIREPGTRGLVPNQSMLQAGGQLRLMTDFGPLDVLGHLHDGRDYDDLVAHSELVGDARRRIRVIDLATLIEIKAGTKRRRDRLVLPILRALLTRRR